jgi:hypothetical protein
LRNGENNWNDLFKVQTPLPPPLPPPMPKSQNGWSTGKITKKQQKMEENSSKEMFKRRTSRTKVNLNFNAILDYCPF